MKRTTAIYGWEATLLLLQASLLLLLSLMFLLCFLLLTTLLFPSPWNTCCNLSPYSGWRPCCYKHSYGCWHFCGCSDPTAVDIPSFTGTSITVGVFLLLAPLLGLTSLLFLAFMLLLALTMMLGSWCCWHAFCFLCFQASLLLLSFMLFLVNCCCWGPVIVGIPFAPGAQTFVGIHSVVGFCVFALRVSHRLISFTFRFTFSSMRNKRKSVGVVSQWICRCVTEGIY